MVAYPGQANPPQANPPPQVPQDPSISNTLTNFLQQFSLWCRRGFHAKMDANTALPGLMFQAYDAPAGTTPVVWLLRVSTNGAFIPVQVPPGGANPGPGTTIE